MQKIWLAVLGISLIVGSALVLGLNYRAFKETQRITHELNDPKSHLRSLAKRMRILSKADQFSGSRALPLDVMLAVSQAVPANAYISQYDYDAIQRTVLVRGRTDRFSVPAQIVEKLSSSPSIRQVTAKGTRKVQINNTVLFDFEIECQLGGK
jgi:hypothetical protein